MNKTTKNIILIVLLVLLFIAAFFTVKQINNRDSISFDKTKITNNGNFDPNNIPNIDNKKEDSVVDDNTNTEKEATESNSTRKRPNMKERPSHNRKQFDFNGNFPKPSNKNNDIFIVLFGIESALSGAIILYLILSNLKKEEVKKK